MSEQPVVRASDELEPLHVGIANQLKRELTYWEQAESRHRTELTRAAEQVRIRRVLLEKLDRLISR